MSFPIFQANPVAEKEYVKELTPQEKKQLKFKEKRLKDWNKNRVKREFVPKIRPHKPLLPVCCRVSLHCAFLCQPLPLLSASKTEEDHDSTVAERDYFVSPSNESTLSFS